MTDSTEFELLIQNDPHLTTAEVFNERMTFADATTFDVATSDVQQSDQLLTPANWCTSCILPVLIVLGVGGNTLTVAIMQTKAFKKIVVSRLLTALALSDTMVLLMMPFNQPVVSQWLGMDLRTLGGPLGCHVFFWFFRMAKLTSSWFVVSISMERFVAVWFPLKAASIVTRHNTQRLIWLIYGGLGAYIAYWSYETDRIVESRCIPNTVPTGLEAASAFAISFGVSLYALIPAFILLISSSLIIGKIIYTVRQREHLSNSDRKGNSVLVKTTIMLMGIAIAFLVLVGPIGVSHLIGFIRNVKIFEPQQQKSMKILREITQVMELMNYSMNFVLYVLSGETFRKMLLQVICCRSDEKLGSKYLTNSSRVSKKPAA